MVLRAQRHYQEVASPLAHALPFTDVVKLSGRLAKVYVLTQNAAHAGYTIHVRLISLSGHGVSQKSMVIRYEVTQQLLADLVLRYLRLA